VNENDDHHYCVDRRGVAYGRRYWGDPALRRLSMNVVPRPVARREQWSRG
jgi:hypothetical protein